MPIYEDRNINNLPEISDVTGAKMVGVSGGNAVSSRSQSNLYSSVVKKQFIDSLAKIENLTFDATRKTFYDSSNRCSAFISVGGVFGSEITVNCGNDYCYRFAVYSSDSVFDSTTWIFGDGTKFQGEKTFSLSENAVCAVVIVMKNNDEDLNENDVISNVSVILPESVGSKIGKINGIENDVKNIDSSLMKKEWCDASSDIKRKTFNSSSKGFDDSTTRCALFIYDVHGLFGNFIEVSANDGFDYRVIFYSSTDVFNSSTCISYDMTRFKGFSSFEIPENSKCAVVIAMKTNDAEIISSEVVSNFSVKLPNSIRVLIERKENYLIDFNEVIIENKSINDGSWGSFDSDTRCIAYVPVNGENVIAIKSNANYKFAYYQYKSKELNGSSFISRSDSKSLESAIFVNDNEAKFLILWCAKKDDSSINKEDVLQNFEVGFNSFANVVLNRNDDYLVEEVNDAKDRLLASCRFGKGNLNKDFQIEIIADSHFENKSVKNAVDISKMVESVDCLIHCGDALSSYYDKGLADQFNSILYSGSKPTFFVIGNHDVGNSMYPYYTCNHIEAYNTWVKPMVDKGILSSGEYAVNKPYYYHDFSARKTRLIVIYEYDAPLDIADNQYWEAISYDSSKSEIVLGNSYSLGDVVNIPRFTSNSFRCKKSVSTVKGQYDTSYTHPYYRIGRECQVISSEQALWLCNALKNTPVGYGVVIAMHNPFSINAKNDPSFKFAEDEVYNGGQFSMTTDLIPLVVDAWKNKTSISQKVICKKDNWRASDASYLNTNDDGDGVKYWYKLNFDFSSSSNSDFLCFIGGHLHRDSVYKHQDYSYMYGINPTCGISTKDNTYMNDISRPSSGFGYDVITCVSPSKNRIGLARIGNIYTNGNKVRCVEAISK